MIFLAVGTPTSKTDNSADLSNLIEVCEYLKDELNTRQVIVIKSTVPVGTNKQIAEIFNKENKNGFEIVSNPEFLREGSAVEDFLKPDRVIIGLRTSQARQAMIDVYKPLYLREFPIVFTDPESAEMIKYAANAILATKISFINEVAHLCEKVGADVKEVAKGIGLDGRIGNKFLHAGPGFGGSCFPKDTRAFSETGKINEARLRIVETVIEVNETVKQRMIDKILDIFEGGITQKTVCILGVTFKPNTDDIRDSPALTIIPVLLDHKANVRIVDPKGKINGESILKTYNGLMMLI